GDGVGNRRLPPRGRRGRRRLNRYSFVSASATAAFAPWKPIFECVPSQNGLMVEPPQRQSAFLRTGISLPSASVRRKSPSTRSGPFSASLIVIVMSVLL